MKDVDIMINNYKMGFTGERRFSPSPTNFHNLKDVNINSYNYSDVMEWRKSNRYKELCKRLYNQGLENFKKMYDEYTFPKKMTKKEVKFHLRVLHTYGNMPDDEYEYHLKHWKEYGETLDNNFRKTRESGHRHSLQLRVAVFQNVFGYGFDNFITVTKENGHSLHGVEYITYSGIHFDGINADSCFVALS